MKLDYVKLRDNVKDLEFSTDHSACFDIRSNFTPEIEGYNSHNLKKFFTSEKRDDGSSGILLMSGERIKVPTGIVFNIPVGYSIRIHPRSGLAWKYGLRLANGEGVIDADYHLELFVLMHNTSYGDIWVCDDERICQGEMIKSLDYSLNVVYNIHEHKSVRVGGFGSTGTE
jgi:dUTP pyrophosphatase